MPLIVANCLLLGRAEAFAAKVPVPARWPTASGMGMGFTLSLCAAEHDPRTARHGAPSSGTTVFGPQFEPWVFMMMPPGGFLTLGIALLGLAS